MQAVTSGLFVFLMCIYKFVLEKPVMESCLVLDLLENSCYTYHCRKILCPPIVSDKNIRNYYVDLQ